MIIFDRKWKKPNYLPENVTFSGCSSGAGWFEHECLHICLNEKWQDLRPEGYLFIADDIFINFLMMSSLPLSQTWYVHTVGINYTVRASIANTWHWHQALRPLEVVIYRASSSRMERNIGQVCWVSWSSTCTGKCRHCVYTILTNKEYDGCPDIHIQDRNVILS